MPLSTGAWLGPYEILAPLGAGGMGEVYRARDTKLDRDVAIKVLPSHLSSNPEALARFEREAKAVAALSHQNILAIHDFGTHDGVTYAVTELLDGETLRSKLDSGPIPQRQAVDYAIQVAKGLSVAHEKGVVHRDLKPENLFVAKDGHVKILDFGLAKRDAPVDPGKETSAPTASGHTEPGTVMGTVGYMSPEQVRGLAVDHRTDIFSLGAVLYELLSGQRAFKKATAADTMSAILKEDPPELEETGKRIPPLLDHTVRRCLEKDRDRRFQTARDLEFALGEASGPAASVARPVPVRKGVLIAAAAFVLVAAAVGLFLARRPAKPTTPGVKRIAVLPFENLGAPEDDYFADGMSDEVRGKLTMLRGIQVIARGSSTPYKKTTKAPQQVAKELDVGYLLTATVRWQKAAGGTSRVVVQPELVEISGLSTPTSKWQQPFDSALTDVFKVQSDIASRVAESLGVELGTRETRRLEATPTQNLAAYEAFLKGEEAWSSGHERDRTALEFYEKAVALDPGFARAWVGVAELSSLLSNGGAIPEMNERARVASEKAAMLAPDSSEACLAVGRYKEFVLNEQAQAIQAYERGLKLAPHDPKLLFAKAGAEYSLGRPETAVADLRQTERLDPQSVLVKLYLGANLAFLKRYREAREVLDRGIVLSPTNPNLLRFKVETYLGEGNLAGARRVLETASPDIDQTRLVANMATFHDLVWALNEQQLDLLVRLTPAVFDGNRGTWGLCLAQAYALRNAGERVRAYAEEARKVYLDQLTAAPQGAAESAELHALMGLSLAYLGKKADAIREGQRAVALTPMTKAVHDGAYYQHQLARIYTLVGEPEKAIDQLEPLLKVPYILTPAWLRIDPNFDPLRGNPRFQKLIAAK